MFKILQYSATAIKSRNPLNTVAQEVTLYCGGETAGQSLHAFMGPYLTTKQQERSPHWLVHHNYMFTRQTTQTVMLYKTTKRTDEEDRL